MSGFAGDMSKWVEVHTCWWVTVNPLGLDLCTTAARDGIVQPHHSWTRGGEGVHEPLQEQP
jgi:hypothetical protein